MIDLPTYVYMDSSCRFSCGWNSNEPSLCDECDDDATDVLLSKVPNSKGLTKFVGIPSWPAKNMTLENGFRWYGIIWQSKAIFWPVSENLAVPWHLNPTKHRNDPSLHCKFLIQKKWMYVKYHSAKKHDTLISFLLGIIEPNGRQIRIAYFKTQT